MPHDGISPVASIKTWTEKYISQLKCSRISFFLKLFLVPYMYAFTCCNLRVGKLDVSANAKEI